VNSPIGSHTKALRSENPAYQSVVSVIDHLKVSFSQLLPDHGI